MSDAGEERLRIDLERKVSSLRRELDAWLAASEAGRRLEKHHTQIRAVKRVLDRPLTVVEHELTAPDLAARVVELEVKVLELHRLWDFFRGKLGQRYFDHFAPTLRAADELAWRCFEPIRDRIGAGVGREPPLVYLNGASSPLTLERGHDFDPEYVAREAVRGPLVLEALQLLPVPVIGIPWYSVDHFADAPIIAHEVGHDVEADLGLADHIRTLIETSLKANRVSRVHQKAWNAWAGEIFADVFATLALGPAFASALVDFLATDPEAIAAETRAVGVWTSYPTDALRLLVVAAALEATGYPSEAAAIRGRPGIGRHAMQSFTDKHDEPGLVVAGLLGDPRIAGLIEFPPARHKLAAEDAQRVLKRQALVQSDARTLAASARLAFDADATKYRTAGVDTRIIGRITLMQDKGVRARAADAPTPERLEATARDRDARIGDAVVDALFGGSRI